MTEKDGHKHSGYNVTDVDHVTTGVQYARTTSPVIHVFRLKKERTFSAGEQFYYRRVIRAWIWRHWLLKAKAAYKISGNTIVAIPDMRTLSLSQTNEPDGSQNIMLLYDLTYGWPPEWACRAGSLLRGEDPYEQMLAQALEQDMGDAHALPSTDDKPRDLVN